MGQHLEQPARATDTMYETWQSFEVKEYHSIWQTIILLRLFICIQIEISQCLLHFRFEIALKCWQFDSAERPTFTDVKYLLSQLSGTISTQSLGWIYVTGVHGFWFRRVSSDLYGSEFQMLMQDIWRYKKPVQTQLAELMCFGNKQISLEIRIENCRKTTWSFLSLCPSRIHTRSHILFSNAELLFEVPLPYVVPLNKPEHVFLNFFAILEYICQGNNKQIVLIFEISHTCQNLDQPCSESSPPFLCAWKHLGFVNNQDSLLSLRLLLTLIIFRETNHDRDNCAS